MLQFIILDKEDLEKLGKDEAVGVKAVREGDPGIILCTEPGYQNFIKENELCEIKRGKMKEASENDGK